MQQPVEQQSEENEPNRGIRGVLIDLWQGMMSFGDFLDSAVFKINHLTQTNYNLAVELARQGKIDDAILRFRITLWLAPEHEPSLYNLACLYHHKGQNQQSLQLFKRILKTHPDHTNALYMVASISPNLLKKELQPTHVPPGLVVEYFDSMAPFYDGLRNQELYRLPALLHQLLRGALDTELARQDMLDVGCGSGLVGLQFREEFANIVGLDISSNMLDIAYRRFDRRGIKIYNQLIQHDIRQYLQQPDIQSFDMITAMQVAPYLGDLQLLAQGAARVLRPGGLLALSFDPYTDKTGYGVMPATGYFGHSLDYVTSVMQQAGMETVRTGEVEAATRKFVQLCFFRKPKVNHADQSSQSG